MRLALANRRSRLAGASTRAVPGTGAEELGGDAREAGGGGACGASRSDHGAGVGGSTGQPLSPDGFRATLTRCGKNEAEKRGGGKRKLAFLTSTFN
jgi:hypothetical protein